MTVKILTFLAIAIGAFFLFRRTGLGAPSRDVGGRPGSEDLVQCDQCGVYRPKTRICDCRRTPTL